MHDPDLNAPPFNPLPPVVWLIVALIIGPELLFQIAESGFMGAAKIGLRSEMVGQFAAFDAVFEYMRENGTYPIRGLWPYVTHLFIQPQFTSALFASVMVLAMGNAVARIFHPAAFFALFILAGAFGAFAYHFIANEQYPAMGAFPGVYGLLGAFAWLNFIVLGRVGADRTQAFHLIALLMGFQLLFNIFADTPDEWIADLGGFLAGFALSWVFAPGALASLLARLRKR